MPRVKPSIHDEMTSLAGWSDQAACRTRRPADWDTVKVNNATSVTEDVERAKDVCVSCPVMMDCLVHGIVFEKTDQVWGGLTDEERDAWATREGLVPA